MSLLLLLQKRIEQIADLRGDGVCTYSEARKTVRRDAYLLQEVYFIVKDSYIC